MTKRTILLASHSQKGARRRMNFTTKMKTASFNNTSQKEEWNKPFKKRKVEFIIESSTSATSDRETVTAEELLEDLIKQFLSDDMLKLPRELQELEAIYNWLHHLSTKASGEYKKIIEGYQQLILSYLGVVYMLARGLQRKELEFDLCEQKNQPHKISPSAKHRKQIQQPQPALMKDYTVSEFWSLVHRDTIKHLVFILKNLVKVEKVEGT